MERKTEVIVQPKGLFAYQKGQVLIRLDDLPAASATWSASSDNRAVFAPNGVNFVKLLPDNGRLFVRVTGHSQQADDATFNLGNVSAVRDRIAAACKWGETGKAKSPGQARAQ